jgi:hypothetical protein
MQQRGLACFGRLVPRLPERGLRTDGVSVATRYHHRLDGTMYPQCLLLVALILSAFPSSAQERGATPTRGLTIVERLRSEFLSVLDNEAAAGKDVSLPARRLGQYLTPVTGAPAANAESSAERYSAERASEMPGGLPGSRPTFRRGSTCWWLWVLFGNELCPAAADRTTIAWSSARGGVSQMSLMRADG